MQVSAQGAARVLKLLCGLRQSTSFVRILHPGTLVPDTGASAPEPERVLELECVRAADQSFLSPYSFATSSILLPALTPEPEGGAQCVSSARWDLCGGCRVTGIPTATIRPGTSLPPHCFQMGLRVVSTFNWPSYRVLRRRWPLSPIAGGAGRPDGVTRNEAARTPRLALGLHLLSIRPVAPN